MKPSITRDNCYKSIFDKTQNKLLQGVPDLNSAIEKLVYSKLKTSDDMYKNRLSEIIKKIFVELYLIEEFLLQSNNLGFQVPTRKLFKEQYGEISSVEYFYSNLEKYIDDFAWIDQDMNVLSDSVPPTHENLIPYKGFINYVFPEAVALAQHHGLPTRFLDWTRDPLYAIFFAIEECEKGDTVCVWAINTKSLMFDLNKGAIALHRKLPHSGLEFLHRQKGLFTEMIAAEGYFYHHGKWPTLDEYINSSVENHNFLRKLELKVDNPILVLDRLNTMDINKSNLMPTYDNVANDIKKNYENLKYENYLYTAIRNVLKIIRGHKNNF